MWSFARLRPPIVSNLVDTVEGGQWLAVVEIENLIRKLDSNLIDRRFLAAIARFDLAEMEECELHIPILADLRTACVGMLGLALVLQEATECPQAEPVASEETPKLLRRPCTGQYPLGPPKAVQDNSARLRDLNSGGSAVLEPANSLRERHRSY